MIEISRILCPVDLSDASRRALDHAVAIARWYGASITVLRVIPMAVPVVSYAGALYPEPMVTSAPDLDVIRVATAAFAGREQGGPLMETIVAEGDAASQIVEHARNLDTGLIVMGTHGLRGFDRLMTGSVTERVLRTTRCPVLTVPPSAPDAVPSAPGLFKRIVCGVDFSPASIRALAFAASVAGEADAHLTAVHVIEHSPVWPLPAARRDAESLRQAIESTARTHLTDAISREVRAFAEVEEIVVTGKAYRALLDIAARQHADLIVLGAHGGLAGSLAFGSTTHHIVRDAACPVVTLRG